jgi:hypothetical protein
MPREITISRRIISDFDLTSKRQMLLLLFVAKKASISLSDLGEIFNELTA